MSIECEKSQYSHVFVILSQFSPIFFKTESVLVPIQIKTRFYFI